MDDFQRTSGGIRFRYTPLMLMLQREFGNIVPGAFTPVLAKHSKSFSLIDCVSVGVDRMQRNFEPMRKQVEAWQRCELTDVSAKVVIYEAFVEGKLEAPKHLARTVHNLYFETEVRGIPVADDLEFVECFHIGVQGTGTHSSIQSDCETGRVSRGPIRAIVRLGYDSLVRRGCTRLGTSLFDATVVYDVTKQLKAGGGYGHIFTGTFLNHATPGVDYNFPYAMLNYRF